MSLASPDSEKILTHLRADDLYMKGIQNAGARDPNDWEQLFASVDSRFKSFETGTVDGFELSTISVIWEGDAIY